MASKSVASVALILLFLNLIFFSMVSSDNLAPSPGECPELGVCVNVVDGHVLGNPTPECCPLLGGLTQLEATVCICDKLRSNILGGPVNVELNLKKVMNFCGRNTTNLICN